MEQKRLEALTATEAHEHELKLKRYQLELENLERIGEEKRKQQVMDENLKERKRQSMAAARAKKKSPGSNGQNRAEYECEECNALAEGRQPRHSSHLMLHTTQNHGATRFGLAAQNN